MSYENQIAKTELGLFAELYQITTSDTVFYYTSYIQDVQFQSNLYLARPIQRGDFSYSDKLRALRVRISGALDTPFLQYIANAPPELTEIKIVRVFLDNPNDFIQLFLGSIISISIAENLAHAECESGTRLLRNQIPKYLFQARCNHRLFDSFCGLIETDFAVVAQIDVIAGPDLFLSMLASYSAGYFTFGHAKYQREVRLITDHTIDLPNIRIRLHSPFTKLAFNGFPPAGTEITIFPGCDKTYAMCLNKYNNITRRLSFDYIPSSNPVIWGFQ